MPGCRGHKCMNYNVDDYTACQYDFHCSGCWPVYPGYYHFPHRIHHPYPKYFKKKKRRK